MSKSTATVEYNKEVFSLLNDLCSINESIIIKKDDDKLLVQRANNAKSIAYRLIVNKESFNFEGDSVAFYKFPEFYQLVSCFENPTLTQTEDKFTISKDKSRINYLLSDASTLSKGPSKLSFDKADVSFILKGSDIKEMKKMIGLLVARNTRFVCADNKVSVGCYNNNHDNSFTKDYLVDDATHDMSFSISSEVFTVMPDGDYKVELTEKTLPNGRVARLVRFTIQKKDISLEIFTAEIDEAK